MAIEDKSQLPPLSPKPLPPFSPEDVKKAQQELARLQRNKKRGFEGKTLWDWLQLLGVPIFLAFATIGFGFVQFYLADQQHTQDQKLADQQHVQDQKLAQQQHDADQNNVLDQQRATTLQTYIDNIQDLLLNHNLLGSKPTGDVAILARARTLTALQGLDPDRKGRLVQFLYEAQLIGFQGDEVDKYKLHNKIIDLGVADLSNANLSYTTLPGADLSGANLRVANLFLANLFGASLIYTYLRGADLRDADLRGANLSNAYLHGADLRGAKLTQQQLDQVLSCTGATLPKGLICNRNL